MFIRVFNFNVKIITMVFLSICYFQLNSIAQLNWSASIDSVSVLSSPRSVDLNNDGIKDVVIGSGTDSAYSNYGVVAINGANGQVLWTTPTRDEIFSSAQFLDVNNDAVKDVKKVCNYICNFVTHNINIIIIVSYLCCIYI